MDKKDKKRKNELVCVSMVYDEKTGNYVPLDSLDTKTRREYMQKIKASAEKNIRVPENR